MRFSKPMMVREWPGGCEFGDGGGGGWGYLDAGSIVGGVRCDRSCERGPGCRLGSSLRSCGRAGGRLRGLSDRLCLCRWC